MATDDWNTEARRLPAIVPAQASTGLSETSDDPPGPTRGHKACIAELALRFPAAKDVDPRQYQKRLDFLAIDTAHLAVPLLRKACDRVAQHARGLPYASEIIAAAAEIVEERQRVRPDDRATVNADGELVDASFEANADACRQANIRLMREGASYRVFPVGAHNRGRVQVADTGSLVATHDCNGDGTFASRLGGDVSALWRAPA